ncbi:hypothetical protein SAMN06265348_10160 [Pedobacter westerhofensis]|uniref:Uncharacterized protein n=1 Tax=Pedobacter westerhofensis TaxID=425512 RepID=A0A521ACW5_9SPHI|nr:STM3941 family protein [Pedobacter westerhofensis]SMO32608.1 hypothetical protein SAMN06265348_10160 [Pedobacter westerhofensis]
MEFYRNKKKSVNLILVCTGILALLIVMFIYSIGTFDGRLSIKLAALSGISGIILVIIIAKKLYNLTDNSPLLVLSPEGITAKVTAVAKAAGLIYWKDIINITMGNVGGDTLITLTVDKPKKYIPTIKKKLSAMVVNGIEDPDGNLPIHLTAAELDITAQELMNVINTYRSQLQNTQ